MNKILTIVLTAVIIFSAGCANSAKKDCIPKNCRQRIGEVVYANDFQSSEPLFGWVMEGGGRAVLKDGKLVIDSPEAASNLVYWIDKPMPENFILTFDFQVQSEDGLCILFICAANKNGQSIFEPALAKRAGNFAEYTNGDINNYLLQYYTQNPTHLEHTDNELRKNAGFALIQQTPAVIERGSPNIYKITVIKDGGKIMMFVDDKLIIDAVDNNALGTAPYSRGYIGLRQMKWTTASYDNIIVRKLEQ